MIQFENQMEFWLDDYDFTQVCNEAATIFHKDTREEIEEYIQESVEWAEGLNFPNVILARTEEY